MVLTNLNYNVSILFFCLGLYIVFASKTLFKKLFGLSIFQNSVLWFYISLAKVSNAHPPILIDGKILYSDPLPHALMLTAIVVGLAISALGLSLIIQLRDLEI